MKIISWNVNGIRAVLKKGFAEFIAAEDPDVICLQETKAQESQVSHPLKGYKEFWLSAARPGYSGTCIMVKQEPLAVFYGMNESPPESFSEGRVITLEYADFFLVTLYTPNAGNELKRLEFRTKIWEPACCQYLRALDRKKAVVVCGDFNVAHKEIDLARPKQNVGSPGFTSEEREAFDAYLNNGFVDIFRHQHPQETGHYTWWSYRAGARPRNVGWRIDYFLVSERFVRRVENSCLYPQILGSDHCPIGLKLKS